MDAQQAGRQRVLALRSTGMAFAEVRWRTRPEERSRMTVLWELCSTSGTDSVRTMGQAR